jgi:parallel beta-helix repeat protein
MRKQQLLTVLALAGWAMACSSSVVGALEITNPNPHKHFYFTLRENLTETVFIQSDNVHLNCNGHSITEPRHDFSGIGIAVLNAKNVTIANCHISGWLIGINIERSPNSQVVSNELSNNGSGLSITDQSAPVRILRNEIRHNHAYGLKLRTSPGDIRMVGNEFLHNGRDARNHFVVLSCCLSTRPLEAFENTFDPPLPPIE